MPASPASTVTARTKLLDAAAELFYAHGVCATGIDAITSHAGVARKSLYNNFASKDELVLAYLQARHEEWLALYDARVAVASTPRERVLAVFDAYLDHAGLAYPHGFRGCGLLNAAAELAASAPGRAVVRGHKEQVESILAEQLGAVVEADRCEPLAEAMSLLLEGAMARAGLEGTPLRLERARALAVDWMAS